MTEAIDPGEVIQTARILEPGDEVLVARKGYEWSAPLDVVDVDVVDWRFPDGGFATAAVTVESRSQLDVEAVSDEEYAVIIQSDLAHVLHRFDPPSPGGEETCQEAEECNEDEDSTADGDEELDVETDADDASPTDDPSSEEASDEFLENVSDASRPLTSTNGSANGNGVSPGAARVSCQNCGNSVSQRYASVFSPQEEPTSVRCCPACPDMVRTKDGEVRPARSSRDSARMVRENR